jgi:hypothetical protein
VQVPRLQEGLHLVERAGDPFKEDAWRFLEGPGGLRVGWRECEGVLELALVKMKGCSSAEECRRAVEEVLALVKERKLEQLREELGVLK